METVAALPKIHTRKFDDTKSFTLYTEHDERVGSIRHEWFANHVVRAVNCHNELLAALKVALPLFPESVQEDVRKLIVKAEVA